MSLIVCYILSFFLMTLYVRERKIRIRIEECYEDLKNHHEKVISNTQLNTSTFKSKSNIKFITNKLNYYDDEIARIKKHARP